MKKVLSATQVLLGTAEHSLLPVIARFSLESADVDSVDFILKGLTEKLGDFLATFSGKYSFSFLIKSTSMISCEVILCEVILYEVISSEVISSEVILCEVILYEVISSEVILCEIILCEVISSEVISYEVIS